MATAEPAGGTDKLNQVIDRLEVTGPAGAGWSAKCPAHDDRTASLSVSEGDTGGVVLYCHAGCDTDKVVAAIGLTLADLAGDPFVQAEYPYTDVTGSTVLYSVERWANPKTFRVRPFLPPVAERVPYQLPWIAHARESGKTLYVVEGEKDANRLLSAGHPATTNVGGAGKWLPHYSSYLDGCQVVVIADADEPGHKHARSVVQSLSGHAKDVYLATVPYGKDISDLFDAGYSLDALVPLPEAGALPLLRASTIAPRKVAWAWMRYFPLGKLSTIEGDPGDGKSTMTVDLAARWSTGAPMPDGSVHGGPFDVIMISAEDDPDDTIGPRLRAAGADLDRVHLLAAGSDPELPFDLGVDLKALEDAILSTKAKVIILDPLASFLPDNADSHSDHKVRRALYPLHLLARRTGVAVLAVRHLSKSATKAVYAGNGSIGIVAAARAAFMVRVHPEDEKSRILAPIKCNLTALPPTLVYRITWDERYGVGRVVWDGAMELTAQELLDGPKGTEERTQREDARDYLQQTADRNPRTWKEIQTRGRQDGYAEVTLRRARDGVLVKIINPILAAGERLVGTFWCLPEQLPLFTDQTTDSSGSAHLLTSPYGRVHEQERKPDTDSDRNQTEDTERMDIRQPSTKEEKEAALEAAEKLCDICGSDVALAFLHPWYAIRCRSHSPLIWSKPDE